MLLSLLRDEIRVEIAGVIDPLIDSVLIASAKEFFRRSNAWRVNFANAGASTINADGSTDYTIVLPADTLVSKTIGVRQFNFPVEPLTQAQSQSGYVRESRRTRINATSNNGGITTTQVIFQTQEANAGKPITVSYSLIPNAITVDIDDAVMLEWGEALQYGAKHRLYRMPLRAWGDPAESQFNYRLFEDSLAKANGRSARGSGAPLRTKSYA